MATLKVVQTPACALYTGLSSVGTSMRITPYPVDLDGTKLTITDFGSLGYCTVDPKVSGYEEIISFTGITDNGDNTATLTGLTRDLISRYPYTTAGTGKTHGASAVVVFSDNPQIFGRFPAKDADETITGQWTFTNTPIVPGSVSDASTTVKGVSKLSVSPVSSSNPIAVGTNDPRVPTADPTTLFAPISTSIPSGLIFPYAGRTAPSGYFSCDGSAISRTGGNATLFSIIAPLQTFTVTSASPAVFTAVAHGLVAGDKIHITTTGGLYSGLAVATEYYVLSAGLTADAFQVALSPEGTAVNTSGSQSGVHTLYKANWGMGDGSTTFNLPDLRSKVTLGLGGGSQTLKFEPAARSSNVINIPNYVFPAQGQAVVLTTSNTLPSGLSTATPYYIIRVSSTSISFAANQSDANQGVAIVLSSGGTGVHSMTFTNRSHTILGNTGGEETHSLYHNEIPSHTHPTTSQSGSGGSPNGYAKGGAGGSGFSESIAPYYAGPTNGGTDAIHNNIQPFVSVNYIIKI